MYDITKYKRPLIFILKLNTSELRMDLSLLEVAIDAMYVTVKPFYANELYTTVESLYPGEEDENEIDKTDREEYIENCVESIMVNGEILWNSYHPKLKDLIDQGYYIQTVIPKGQCVEVHLDI